MTTTTMTGKLVLAFGLFLLYQGLVLALRVDLL